jgi:hypothetical protein
MKTKDIALVAGVGLAAFAAYQYFMRPTPPPGYGGANYIPAGGQWGGFANTSGQPVWVQAVGGAVSIVNSLGQVLSSIPWTQFSGGGNYTGGNLNPQSGNGQWVDANGELTWVSNA